MDLYLFGFSGNEEAGETACGTDASQYVGRFYRTAHFSTNVEFIKPNAVNSGVADVKKAVETARENLKLVDIGN